ncbi:hypothetical protein TH63_09130 [Rufibacter radiotolerans]|uniref:Uncharacterized protein n=1 Tax=Rufibacter radiotolerans TaxID=1379910 RepID=A0A0H4VIY4_9BACT|nr:hypothetical protein [Rufibacter radiotolerans]AKQ45775.1 hypothetical protein TH63_09130 [Rufibacter radiotolerans]
MEAKISTPNLLGWLFGSLVFIIGVLNLVLVHPVPAFGYFFLSCLYLPPTTALFKQWFGFTMPGIIKIVLGIVIVMFTLGVSDLGDMIDKL